MELWLRVPSRNGLIKVDNVFIKQNNKEMYEILTKMDGTDYHLAMYETKERALEVLDEIEDLLVPKLHHVCDRDLEGNEVKVLGLDYIQSIVYQMPEE